METDNVKTRVHYLMRHGHAVEAAVDPMRPLSDKGRKDIQRMGLRLAREAGPIHRIYHSPKKRAEQTARILSEVLVLPIESRAELSPDSDVQALVALFKNLPSLPHLLIGHLPLLEEVLALLDTAGHSSFPGFAPGSVVALEENKENWFLVRAWHPD